MPLFPASSALGSAWNPADPGVHMYTAPVISPASTESGDAVSLQTIGHEHATNPGGGRRGSACVEIEDLDRLTAAAVGRIDGVSAVAGSPDAQAVQVGVLVEVGG
ncbi:hypothetical protein [Nocardia abscessus]|uniref:hypothetical protein n=1 Tax=Nocardia abscessus TaxID=120957 RepID=UPI002453FDC6|nr:hypothetical protein [Nocardia abscessus]